jgi:CO/xanthine dehydrogenase Mo-binding subunit
MKLDTLAAELQLAEAKLRYRNAAHGERQARLQELRKLTTNMLKQDVKAAARAVRRRA